jgi:SHS2 domain-containing protein
MMAAGYELVEHISELELRVHGPTWAELLAEAGRALGVILRGDAPPVEHVSGAGAAPLSWRHLDVQALDRTALLVDWLNELLLHAESEWWIPVVVRVETASDHHVRARVGGVSVAEAPAAVKAVTLHRARVVPGSAGLEATAVLDV